MSCKGSAESWRYCRMGNKDSEVSGTNGSTTDFVIVW
jgi:hypothetical protein